MTTPVEAAEAPVTLRAALFCAALDAACQVEGAELATALGLGDAAPAGHAERRARAACILGLSEPSAAPLAVALGWWGSLRSVSATLSRARVTGAASGKAARAVWDVLAVAGVRELNLLDISVADVRSAAGLDPAPVAPKPDNRAAIEAAFDRALPDRAVPDPAGREAPPLRVIAGTRPARAPVRVLQGDPARQVPLARAFSDSLFITHPAAASLLSMSEETLKDMGDAVVQWGP